MFDLTLLNSKVKRCQHIKADGAQCNLPAVGGHSICHRHEIVRRSVARPSHYDTPFVHVEDSASLQLALNDVIARLLRGHVDRRDAALIIRSLRAILSTMRMEHHAPTDVSAVVRDYSQLSPHVEWAGYMTEEDRKRQGEEVSTAYKDRARALIDNLTAEYDARQAAARAAEGVDMPESAPPTEPRTADSAASTQ